MATKFLKVDVTATLSKRSDYGSPKAKTDFDAYESITPTDGGLELVTADTGGTTYSLAKYTTIDVLIVKNTDPTNYVTVAFQNAAASAQSQKITFGKTGVFTDVLASSAPVLTANSAAVECEVFVAGT